MRPSNITRRTIALHIKTALRCLGRGLLIVIAAQLFAVPVQADSEAVNEVAKLLPGDGAADDLFGQKVAIDGDTAVIAASATINCPILVTLICPFQIVAKNQRLTVRLDSYCRALPISLSIGC